MAVDVEEGGEAVIVDYVIVPYFVVEGACGCAESGGGCGCGAGREGGEGGGCAAAEGEEGGGDGKSHDGCLCNYDVGYWPKTMPLS